MHSVRCILSQHRFVLLYRLSKVIPPYFCTYILQNLPPIFQNRFSRYDEKYLGWIIFLRYWGILWFFPVWFAPKLVPFDLGLHRSTGKRDWKVRVEGINLHHCIENDCFKIKFNYSVFQTATWWWGLHAITPDLDLSTKGVKLLNLHQHQSRHHQIESNST